MSNATTRTRAALRTQERRPHRNLGQNSSMYGTSMRQSSDLIDITEEAVSAARPGRAQQAQGAQSGRNAHAANPRVGARPSSGSDELAIRRALLFAHGLDEGGRRLPLASDAMSEEERRPHHILAERQNAPRIPAEFSEIYRVADCFDDDLPNITAIRPLTHKVRVATTDRTALSASGAPRFEPRTTVGLRVLPGERSSVTAGSSTRRDYAPASTVASTGGPGSRRTEPSAMSRATPSRAAVTPSRSAQSVTPGRARLAQQGNDGAEALSAVGALALARAVPASVQREANSSGTRASLRTVPTSRRGRPVGVVAFWVLFVVAFLFVAVVMHAGIANRQMTLDEINVELEQAEFTNAQMRVEVASLQSPTRIAQEASRLGLSNPKGIRFVQAVPASVALPVTTVAAPVGSETEAVAEQPTGR